MITENGPHGLIEIKTVLNSNKKLIFEATNTEKNFCLKKENEQISLKRNHNFLSNSRTIKHFKL